MAPRFSSTKIFGFIQLRPLDLGCANTVKTDPLFGGFKVKRVVQPESGCERRIVSDRRAPPTVLSGGHTAP